MLTYQINTVCVSLMGFVSALWEISEGYNDQQIYKKYTQAEKLNQLLLENGCIHSANHS